MGTSVAIEAAAPSETIAASSIGAAFAAVAEVERRMHPAREGSDVARINAAPPGARTPIHASTAEVLSLALKLHGLTDGVFDPCLPMRPGRLSDLQLSDSPRDGAWVVARMPLALDLGGIAKGYAIDCAVSALRTGGCRAGVVNAGGDLRLFGQRPETILVRGPGRSYSPLTVMDAALAVSDLDESRRPPEHRGYYTRSGDGGQDAPSGHRTRGKTVDAVRRHAAVLAADAMSADGLTKCVLLCPERLARRALASFGGRDVTGGKISPRLWLG